MNSSASQQQQQQQQQDHSAPQVKRSRHSKRSTLNEIITNNSTSLMKPSSISYENIKNESWMDPILQSFGSKTHSPLHCQTTLDNHSYSQTSNSYLSPTSSPDSLTISSLTSHPMNDLSSLLTPSPSTSPSSSSSSKANVSQTKLDETDMLLLDSSAFDFDAYLYETATNDIDVQPLLTIKSEHDLYNDFHAALTDLTSSAEAAAAIGADTNAFDAFDYSSKHSTFNCLFDDDDQQQPQPQISSLDSSNYSTDLSIKGCGIKRPQWWSNNETHSSTKLPSLETAFDLKLSK